MACKLNRAQVLDLFEVIYGEIIDRINDSNLPTIDVSKLIKETFDVVKQGSDDQVKAMLYAQAIPDVFYLVTQDEEVNDYLVDNNFDFTGLAKMRKRYADLTEVGKDIATKKVNKSEIDSKIKEANKGKKDFVPNIDVDSDILWSYNEDNGYKVSSSWTTTIQQALSKNPETVSEEDRNIMNPEKIMFGEVVKSISRIAKERVGAEPILYQGKTITLTAMLTRNIDKNLLVSEDKQYMIDNPNDNGITTVITDEKGNFLYFTEEGDLTENPEDGRIVYQYLRKVSKVDGKLILGNPKNLQGRKYTLLSPEIIAARQKARIIENGGKVSDELFKQLVNNVEENQKKELNQLYQLRKLIEDGTVKQFILPIMSATLGIAPTKSKIVSLEEAGLTESDIKNYNAITIGKWNGKQFVIVKKTKAGSLSVDQEVFLQRGDIDSELANKISKVLTTKALLKGRELTPKERKAYFEVYINNSKKKEDKTNRDRIQVFVRVINNVETFVVELNGEKIPDEVLYTEEGAKMISEHLNGLRESSRPKFAKAGEKEGSNGYWPANVSYNNSLKGKNFDDYIIENGVIKEKSQNYFDAIKNYIKIEYVGNTLADENGINAYISFVIPEGTIENKEVIPLYKPKPNSKPEYKPKKDKEETKPIAKKQNSKKPVTTDTIKTESPYEISMKQQIKDAGGKVENYKTRQKTVDLAKLVNLSEEQILEFRAIALDSVSTTDTKADVKPIKLTQDEVKKTNIENNPSTRVGLFDDIMRGSSNSAYYKQVDKLERNQLRNKFLDQVFTSKADRDRAEIWWNNSPLSKFMSLERITQLVNSNAFATWAGYGITLYEGDGGTMIDVYHEAWHGFSQLLLTKDEKIALYEEILTLPKYKGKTFFDIEEELAEEFRTYAKSKGKKEVKGLLGKIFDKIYQFIQKMFGKITKKQAATNLQDVASVKELFDKLYRASENPEILSNLMPSMDNVMFGKLNRSKVINDNFTLEESKKVADAMDSMMAIIFQNYNTDFNTTAGAIKLLKNPEYKKDLYKDVYDRFEKLRLTYVDELEKDFDLIIDPLFSSEFELLDKITLNFGNLTDSLEGKEKNNVIAYHLEKSRYKVLKDQYMEIEDPTNIEQSNLFKLNDGGNSISAKDLASEETMMLLSSIFLVTKENGKIIQNRDGLFGLPKLQEVSITWNKLAKILQGSFDEIDMYLKILESSENYPELNQLLTLLPNPFLNAKNSMGVYSSSLEFDSETNFWQDFKKPRIPYIQLNLNKVKIKQDDEENQGLSSVVGKDYEARVAKANFDVYQVIQDWKNNFSTADSKVNPYITKDKFDRNILNTKKIIEDFNINGVFNYTKANEFLKAIGIVLDESSAAIKSLIKNTNEPFSTTFGIDRMFEVIKIVNKSTSPDAYLFKRDPLTYLLNGLPEPLRKDENQSEEVRGRIRALAEIQNAFSDGYSNFSVQTPEGNRVWEHMLDNTITRIVTSINSANNWQELTTDAADPNGRFKHMRWLSEDNNTFTSFSKLLNSIFDLDPMSSTYGEKITDTKLLLQHVAGTQMVSNKNDGGTSTASMDATAKYLQEFHTMLLSGVEEFMRHASKNTAMSMTLDGEIKTYNGKKASKLYVDIESFVPYSDGELKSYDIIEGYFAGEANRIVRFKQNIDKFKTYAGYNRKVKRKDGKKTSVLAGEAFTAFDDILSEPLQLEIYSILDKASENPLNSFNIIDELNVNNTLRNKIRADVSNYFQQETSQNLDRLKKSKYVDASLMDRIRVTNNQLTNKEIEEALIKAYTYNSFIHKMETVILAYGDLVQYNHSKEEFHKRNAGLASGGRGFRSDRRAQVYLNSMKKYYAERRGYETRSYDGTLKTAIIKEMTFNSVMYKEYRDEIEETFYLRTKDRKKAKEMADIAASEYFSSDKEQMKIADGQGYISFETYRLLKKAEGNFSDEQELLYRKVSLGKNISVEDVMEFFPPYKLQYFGNIESPGMPVNSFHKFSLAPIIPGVNKVGTPLYDLHEKMMKDQIDYVLFETGSKVSHIGTGDILFNEDGTFNKDAEFTVNTIYSEFLKNQTEINSTYKGKSIFSTQLRKLILEGLYAQGKIKSTKYKDITEVRVKRYVDHVEEYTNLLKLELLEEMGYEETTPGEYKPKNKSSLSKLLNVIRENLEREDVLSDALIEFIDVFDETGELEHDLSYHPEASKIEKLLLSMINKRIIKQKVTGEPLVQVSVAMYANQFEKPDLKKASKDEIKKWASATYLLPTYHKKSNGYTAATKVMVAMQGTYYNLFNLEYQNGEILGVYLEDGKLDMDASLERLNEKIKDDSWLDANDGAARKAITMVGVRIPVQGLNSMEYAEIFEFLPPQAGNIIISAAEIVAKSGGDFDIDKLTIFMNTLDENGRVVERQYKDNNEIKNLRGTNDFIKAIDLQKKALENELIDDIKNILELPENYASLIMPNGTYILKDISEKLSSMVMEYNPKKNRMTQDTGEISPTRILESLYNIYKHESNIVGKKTLGLGAIENTFNVILNVLGAYMPSNYVTNKVTRTSNMRLRHNKMEKNGEEVISISDLYDVDGLNKISDVISQMINGWVDVEKDAWIFFIQGNYEVAPTLIYLIKSGVPVKEAIYFVSNPLVREYVDEQRLAKSTFAEVLGKKPKSPGLAKYQASSAVIRNNFIKEELSSKSKNDDRYETGQELLNDYFKDKKQKHFTESDMLSLIESNDKTSDMAKAMFLHYLELEQQIAGYTALKMSSNPDTGTDSTLSDVEQTESNIEDLFDDSRVPTEIVEAMMDDSILKSFFNGPLALAVSRPLYKLRYHAVVSRYLIERKGQIKKDLETTFPGKTIEIFSNVFRNDIVSFIFQNAIRKYKKEDGFMSLNLETTIPTSIAKELTRGAFVKNGTLYMDMKQLRNEFEDGAWVENADVDNNYEDRGLYPLHPATFMNNSEVNFNEYVKFVSEREYLRSIKPLNKEYVDSFYFQEELKNTKELFEDLSNEKLIRYTYEKLLAIDALNNAYNFYHIFQDKNDSFAMQITKIIQTYPELKKDYPVLDKLKFDSDKDDKSFNLFIADKDFDTDKSNLYSNDIIRLGDKTVQKVKDPIENDRISAMFKYLNIYSFLQTGLNKTKLSFTNITDYTDFLDIVELEGAKFIDALNKNGFTLLDNFYDQFIRQNLSTNLLKTRFKDYLSDIDYENVERIKPVETPTIKRNKNKTSTQSSTSVKPKGTINVYWGQAESATSTKILSNLAPRKFTYQGKEYGSVEHAYQTLKSGAFDQATYDAYVKAGGYGTKIRGKAVTQGFDNLQLIKDLVVESFKQNSNSEAAKKLLQYENFTHNTNEIIDKAFLEGLKLAQQTLLSTQSSTSVESDSTNMDTVNDPERFGLKNTDQDNIFTYDDSTSKNSFYYINISKNNSDVVFIHNTSVYEIKPEQRAAGKNLGGSSYFMTEVPDMSINIPTDLFASVVNGQKVQLNPEQYNTLKNIWEKRIDLIKQIQEKNGKIAFPEYGFGNTTTMPQELFVYLSKRLFEEFQYVNPGSTMYNEIKKMVNVQQGISDEEILIQLELEEDPFKCS
jgi:hypothetical protein